MSYFFSVHYLNWCFELDGNVSAFRKIVNAKEVEEKHRSIVRDFFQNKHFLHLADEVITLSRFCKNLLQSDYDVSPEKLKLIFNGLQEPAGEFPIAEDKKSLILFVGRLDKIKGVDYLIDAFRIVLKKHEEARLVIVGDGDYNECLKHCKDIWGKVIFTGKITQEELSVFYRQVLVGVLPSFHEQCSYTAIEFMMHGIPFIGTDSTGLSEMFDCVPHLRVHIRETDFSATEFTMNLANAICSLLEDDLMRQETSQIMRAQFKEKYTLQEMEKHLVGLVGMSKSQTEIYPLSHDFFNELDDYMISLIHDKVDIDTDFYGMAGIGVYLWWRIGLPDLRKDEAKSFKIKEYLIYYLDWFYETATNEQKETCELEMAATLNGMYHVGFYKTRVDSLMDLLHCKNGIEAYGILSPLVILQNAMRMFTTKT